MKNFFIIPIAIALLSGCGPVKIEGDVFLVKGDGSPKPSAAKEVIFIEANSFEDFLINIYLKTVESDLDSSTLIIKEICKNATANINNGLQKTEALLNTNLLEQKNTGVTDQDGSCDLIQKKYDEASAVSLINRDALNLSITKQENIITQAERKLLDLESRLEQKITKKEDSLYQEFIDGIEISLSGALNRDSYNKRGVLTVSNNTPYNIKLKGRLCLQFYNSEGEPVGTTYDGTLYECSYSQSGMAKGTQLRSSDLNRNIEKDEFGFYKGGFLKKGQTITQRFETNAFCSSGNYSASKAFSMTRKYGEDRKKWPDLDLPDLTKGYTVIKPTGAYNDQAACGHNTSVSDSKFIPLKDEVRTERGDIVDYSSQEIDFRKIAEAESYEERDLIKAQQEIIINAKNRIEDIIDESLDDPIIVEAENAQARMDQCSLALQSNKYEEEQIKTTKADLNNLKSCNINDGKALDTLLRYGSELTSLDSSKLEELVGKDYSVDARYEVLKRFSESKYKASTNISGHYLLSDIPKGNYVVYSSYQDNFLSGIYLDNIEITGDSQIDLSNIQFKEVGSLSNVIEVFFELCSGLICSESDLKFTLDLDEAERRYKKEKESLEDLQDSLRELERLLGG